MKETPIKLAIPVFELTGADRHRWAQHQAICHGEAPGLLLDPRHHPTCPTVNSPLAGPEACDCPRAEPPLSLRGAMEFHLALADGGALLVLFRAGHLPQAIRINELVGDWLDAVRDERR